ncbi:hypothetical protein [Streptomyces iakyrus]|uniref:hypothetical protein n=1 Tax=Streptomyces iakyrus TaxID=68219 RepID=UPI0033FCA604
MLLRDSDVARQVRVYLLDMEYLARTQPVENPAPADTASLDARIDQRITHILGRTVVPLFNTLIETSGEHRRELTPSGQASSASRSDSSSTTPDCNGWKPPGRGRPLAGVMAAVLE